MAATQYIIATYDAIWALLEAHTAFWTETKAGNRIDWTTGKAVVKKNLANKAPGDFPEVELEIPATGSDPGTTATAHYGDDDVGAAWLETPSQSFVLRITCESGNATRAQLLEQEAMTALRKGRSKLGLDEVFSWGPVGIIRREDERNKRRLHVLELTIPVSYRFASQALTI